MTRIVCPHCGEYERYALMSVRDFKCVYWCKACDQLHEWVRASVDHPWRVARAGGKGMSGEFVEIGEVKLVPDLTEKELERILRGANRDHGYGMDLDPEDVEALVAEVRHLRVRVAVLEKEVSARGYRVFSIPTSGLLK